MRSTYKKLGPYIKEVNIRDTESAVNLLLGVSIDKIFIPSIANTIGTDMSTYKIIKRNQFAYGPVTSRNGDKISIALLEDEDEAIISQSYKAFEISNKDELLPQYLMMWFSRPEFDRYARFMSHGSTREVFDWEEMCNVELPVPHPDKQMKIVREYNVLKDRIALNNKLIQKLEETAQAIYKQWFVDFEFPDENGKPYKSSGGEMVWCEEIEKEVPKGWSMVSIGHFFEETIGGDWGKECPEGNYNQEVVCIRGTDIPSFNVCSISSAPHRYILSKNLDKKKLAPKELVIEISGGSTTQSTGRVVLMLEKHFENAEMPIICSNFCRALTLKNNANCYYIYSLMKDLYSSDILFNFENSTIGLKNFDLSAFLKEQVVLVPEKYVILKFNGVYKTILDSIFVYGSQSEVLINNQNLVLSNLFSRY